MSGNTITKKKYHIDTTALHFPKKGMEVGTYLRDGMIEDWDMFEQVTTISEKIYKMDIQSNLVITNSTGPSIFVRYNRETL